MGTAIPDSRSYIHVTCGQSTELTDSEFKVVSTPLPGTRMTMCAACCRYFPIADFKWEDTGEDVVAYYERHRATVPTLSRWMCTSAFGNVLIVAGAVAGVGVAVAAWFALGVIWSILIGVLAVPGGMLAGLFLWDWNLNRILRGALDVPDVRCLK